MKAEYFTQSDGWLFACLGKGKLNLYGIISNGDYLNRAIFNLDEINGGLSRLESEGFIVITNSKLSFTDKGKAFKKANDKRFESCIQRMLRYCDVFEKIPLENPTVYREYFNLSEYNKVIEKYCPY